MNDVVKLISAFGTVSAIDKRSIAKRAWKDAGGDVHIEREDIGWFIALKEWGIAIGVGSDEPHLKVGQRVKLTIEGL